MNNAKLQDFVTQAAARRQITFGDVRRLQRDCLPAGISADEEVQGLVWLDSTVTRADKAWCQWLVASVADFALRSDVTEEGVGEWLKRLMANTAQGATVRPGILRQIARGKAGSRSLTASHSAPAAGSQVNASPSISTHEEAAEGTDAERTGSGARLKEKSTKGCGSSARSRGTAAPAIVPAPLVWSAGMAWKHTYFPLAAPCD